METESRFHRRDHGNGKQISPQRSWKRRADFTAEIAEIAEIAEKT
jgi:hypothetical protein